MKNERDWGENSNDVSDSSALVKNIYKFKKEKYSKRTQIVFL